MVADVMYQPALPLFPEEYPSNPPENCQPYLTWRYMEHLGYVDDSRNQWQILKIRNSRMPWCNWIIIFMAIWKLPPGIPHFETHQYGNAVSFPRMKAFHPKETNKNAQHFEPEPVPLPRPIGNPYIASQRLAATCHPYLTHGSLPRMCFGFTWSLAPTWKHKTMESWHRCCGQPWMGMKVPWVGWEHHIPSYEFIWCVT